MRSPTGYDLNNPFIINLTKKIDQISGIVYSAADSSLFAIDDDTGDLYNIPLNEHPDIKKWKFGKKADHEDLVLADSSFYVLESSGIIKSFTKKFPITEVKEYKPDLKGINEFESLYYEPLQKRIIMLCKECNEDDRDVVSAYVFDISSHTFSDKPVLQLDRKKVEAITNEKTGRLKFSAATVNPLTGEIFMISSINRLLIVTDKNYNVKETYDLKRSLFEQPEGICFSPDGTLFVSNEASPNTKANVLVFKRK